MADKESEYKALCEEVRNCAICENVKFSPHFVNSDFLAHESKNREHSDDVYINKWNLAEWNPNPGCINADIMVIGQDYGAFDNNKSPTDKSLEDLINTYIFNGDGNKKPYLYLTNMANCYRQKKSTGKLNKGCLYLCAHKFMGRLIRIISPKVIIVLGQETFDALAFCDGANLLCKEPYITQPNNNFSAITSKEYELKFKDGKSFRVFPVYHPGSNRQLNRKHAEQSTDWKKIREYLKKENLL